MKIERIVVGQLMTNCYLLKKDNKILIIDPGDDGDLISDRINGDVVGIVITHYHFDHIGALKELQKLYNCPVFDISNIKEGNCSIADFNFECIYFPGHKEDLIALFFSDENCMFVGDFVFANGIGRIDLPGGNIKEMITSIKKLRKYDENIKLYPGHGEPTTIKDENNSLLEFIDYYENLI